MKTAKMFKSGNSASGACWRAYKLEPPLQAIRWNDDSGIEENVEVKFIVVSAVLVPGSGPETYIFVGNEHGEVVDWIELDGSFQGDLDHERALSNIGYRSK